MGFLSAFGRQALPADVKAYFEGGSPRSATNTELMQIALRCFPVGYRWLIETVVSPDGRYSYAMWNPGTWRPESDVDMSVAQVESTLRAARGRLLATKAGVVITFYMESKDDTANVPPGRRGMPVFRRLDFLFGESDYVFHGSQAELDRIGYPRDQVERADCSRSSEAQGHDRVPNSVRRDDAPRDRYYVKCPCGNVLLNDRAACSRCGSLPATWKRWSQ